MKENIKILIGIIIGGLILALIVCLQYQNYQKTEGKISLALGDTYLGPEKDKYFPSKEAEQPQENRFTATQQTPWIAYSGKIYPYTFSYPETLKLVSFPNDPSDSVAIDWEGIPVGQNIFLNIELIKDKDPSLVSKPKEYVEGWWQYFSGLKGIHSVTDFTNSSGLKGYKAIYINQADESPNVDVFFEIPKNPGILIHLANGVLDQEVFEKIIDSLKLEP